jgi:hypothetical protein
MTATQSAGRSIAITGFPLSAWAFALRIWAAMMVALYAAFWLQLESASPPRSPSAFSPCKRAGSLSKGPLPEYVDVRGAGF